MQKTQRVFAKLARLLVPTPTPPHDFEIKQAGHGSLQNKTAATQANVNSEFDVQRDKLLAAQAEARESDLVNWPYQRHFVESALSMKNGGERISDEAEIAELGRRVNENLFRRAQRGEILCYTTRPYGGAVNNSLLCYRVKDVIHTSLQVAIFAPTAGTQFLTGLNDTLPCKNLQRMFKEMRINPDMCSAFYPDKAECHLVSPAALKSDDVAKPANNSASASARPAV